MDGKRVSRRWWVPAATGLALFLAALAGATAILVARAPDLDPTVAGIGSRSVLDRNGELLRAFTTPEGRWRLPIGPEAVDPRYLQLLKGYEDRRFDRHWGIDPWALVRAAGQLLLRGHVVSGGSTLTMQTARLLMGRHERSASGKIEQIGAALKLEHRLSKREILSVYLSLAPFGGNVEGVRAASLAYLGKEPRRLSLGEAALLVAIPQSPEWRRPDRHPELARLARDRVLARAHRLGLISQREEREARNESVPRVRREVPKLAPHLTEALATASEAPLIQPTTLDKSLQGSLEVLARGSAHALGPEISTAILVADHHTGEILAYVGASDYLDHDRKGPVDMVMAVRSPGSTLKPVIYGLGFELGLAHPETLIEDRPARFGTYRPQNFDQDFHGTVSIREALAQSLNIPAVKMLNAVGPGRLAWRLDRAGFQVKLPAGEEPSLAMALGGAGLRLFDLAGIYAALAEGGRAPALHWSPAMASEATKRHGLMSKLAAAYVTDILKDAPPPANAKGGRFAYKTGTSYGYRDAWAVGYDGRHVVAVWTGRADGATTLTLAGRTAALPILFDAFERLGPERVPLPPLPQGAIHGSGADLPPPLKRFTEGGAEPDRGPYLDPPVAIQFPPDRAEVEPDPDGLVVLKAAAGVLPLTWLVDGAPIPSDATAREVAWKPSGAGFAKVQVIDAEGHVDRVSIRIRE